MSEDLPYHVKNSKVTKKFSSMLLALRLGDQVTKIQTTVRKWPYIRRFNTIKEASETR